MRHQVQEIAYSLLAWDSGSFQFLEGEERTGENITTSLTVPELLLEGLRRIKDAALFQRRIPSRDIVFERVLPANRPTGLKVEEYEKHVFHLVDGTRSVQEICDLSEVGEFETLKTLYVFFTIGFLHVRRRKDRFAEEQKEMGELRDLVKSYNEMFTFLLPLPPSGGGSHCGKYSGEIPGAAQDGASRGFQPGDAPEQRSPFRGAHPRKPKAMSGNRRAALVDALNEYLYSALLAIRRTLGTEHEQKVLQTLRSTRKDLFHEPS